MQIENANRISIWDSAELYFRIHDNILWFHWIILISLMCSSVRFHRLAELTSLRSENVLSTSHVTTGALALIAMRLGSSPSKSSSDPLKTFDILWILSNQVFSWWPPSTWLQMARVWASPSDPLHSPMTSEDKHHVIRPLPFVGSEANFMVFLNSIPGRRRTRRPLAIHRPAWDAGKNSIFGPFEAKKMFLSCRSFKVQISANSREKCK